MRAARTARLAALALACGLTAVAGPAVASAGTAASGGPAPGVAYLATVKVQAEAFRLRLVEVEDIKAAFDNLAGRGGRHPNGRIVRTGPGDNIGYGWHLDPQDVQFVERSIELCDGLPSAVDDATFSSDRYCPWSAKVVRIERLLR